MKCIPTNTVEQILEKHATAKLKLENSLNIKYSADSDKYLLSRDIYSKSMGEVYEELGMERDMVLYVSFRFPPAIGIDLGTTNSVVAIYYNGAVQTLAHGGTNSVIHPSIVGFVDNEDVLISWEAHGEDSGTILYDAKRIIGRKWDDRITQLEVRKKAREGLKIVEKNGKPCYLFEWDGEEQLLPPSDVTKYLFAHLKKIADSYMSREEIKHCVVTVPANFNSESRAATIRAANAAGLNVLRLINEPTAAAIAYSDMQLNSISGTWDGTSTKRLLLFDLGGGTADVTILTIGKNKFVVEATKGLPYFGGRNFDDAIVEAFIHAVSQNHPDINTSSFGEADYRALRFVAEKAKRKVNMKKKYRKKIVVDGNQVTFALTREQFNELANELVNTCIILIEKTLREANLDKSDIDWVVPVGGGSNMHVVVSELEKYFGHSMPPPWMPGEAIARGAALVASGSSPKIVERLAQSLGVAQSDGKMKKLLKRGTVLPAISEPLWMKTKHGSRKRAKVEIWVGESKWTQENTKLKLFNISLAGTGGKGEEKVKLRVKVDENAIVTVYAESATETTTEKVTL
eukprot:TRINITY_DN10337_c0_g1_i1.p1 TRINITY_DN10337_c0_g1~~TRINITY_DN10337_c0_g1_i1.p1  ORF type:complete len:594 (-),score=139.72 TRINITY_DN10337_c0_g1_i1:9-1727(-)